MDWGLLGYWLGEIVQDEIPVLTGHLLHPTLIKLKHFGAAAASSGGVEMYHIPSTTAEARSEEEAFAGRDIVETLEYGNAERRRAYENLNCATERKIDFVMLGCPHNAIEQVGLIAALLDGKHIHADTALWVHTPRALRDTAARNGYVRIIEEAGGVVMSDTCPAISRHMPKGVRTVATDSAKQAHYLPAITGVQAWFGSVRDCVEAAIAGTWNGSLR
jgi:predicted aconitase